MPFSKHVDGDLAESLATAHFIKNGYWVFRTNQAHSAVDLICIHENGEVLLLDVKKDAGRTNKKNGGARISRLRSELQKQIGVKLCYVNLITGAIHVADHRE